MRSRIVWVALFLSTAGLLSAEPRTASGTTQGPSVVLVRGTPGTVRLLHEGALVREIPAAWDYAGAIILAGAKDSVEWDGKAATPVAAGTDAPAAARQALDGQSAPYQFVVRPDGSLEEVKKPEGEGVDGETAATEE